MPAEDHDPFRVGHSAGSYLRSCHTKSLVARGTSSLRGIWCQVGRGATRARRSDYRIRAERKLKRRYPSES